MNWCFVFVVKDSALLCLQATTYSAAARPQRYAGYYLSARHASSDASLDKEINDDGYTQVFPVICVYVV